MDVLFMRGRNMVVGLTAVLGAVMSIGACSSGQPKADLTPGASSATGASSPAAASGSATPSDTTTSSSAASDSGSLTSAFPGFTLPADIKVTIDPDTTGDPVKDKILADNSGVIMSYVVADATGNVKTPGVSTYLGPVAVYNLLQVEGPYHAAGKTPTGSVHYYARKVPAVSGSTARVVWCQDLRQYFDKDASGKSIPGSNGTYNFWTAQVQKNAAGVWQSTGTQMVKDAPQCAPTS